MCQSTGAIPYTRFLPEAVMELAPLIAPALVMPPPFTSMPPAPISKPPLATVKPPVNELGPLVALIARPEIVPRFKGDMAKDNEIDGDL